MALPMLINGSECGPVNPLQGLAKRFDQDRGSQQDLFVNAQAGPSRPTFRTQRSTAPGLGQEASRFFSSDHSTVSSPSPSAFNLSEFRNVLPTLHAATPPVLQSPSPQSLSLANTAWAAEFLGHQPQSPAPLVSQTMEASQSVRPVAQRAPSFNTNFQSLGSPVWTPSMDTMHHTPQFMPFAAPQVQQVQQTKTESTALLWDKEFQSQELLLSSGSTIQAAPLEDLGQYLPKQHSAVEADDLARTAGLLVDTIKDEQNPKFKNSQFLGLMRQLRDGSMVVDGNDMVESSTVSFDPSTSDLDRKGKARAVVFEGPLTQTLDSDSSMILENHTAPSGSVEAPRQRRKSVHFDDTQDQEHERPAQADEDPNDAYFQQENAEYINYWNTEATPATLQDQDGQMSEWGFLQDDWDALEIAASGIKAIPRYQFQPHNPYLRGNSTSSRAHLMHTEGQSFYESVLELEATVQREPRNATAWFDLGVKQQENEREPKAILALRRALQFDADHLPAWLALAISHTNENDRADADDAIEQWVLRNKGYEGIVNRYKAERSESSDQEDARRSKRHADLIECLMAMARNSTDGEIDADVQIALAVLLNTGEDYQRAQDCFRTALAVRPDDWQLYNRVGATLANSGSAEEALQYYYRALELNPVYIRARFNLGISCINMRKYEEAAQHILDALVLQDSDGAVNAMDDKRGITSSALWDSLKTTCLHLQRIDLATLCDRQDLDGLRHEFHV